MSRRSNRDIYRGNNDKIDDQNGLLDEIINEAEQSRQHSRNINEEAKSQNSDLNHLNKKMKKNVDGMQETSEILDIANKKRMIWKLYIVIAIEILFFFIIMVIL